MTRPEGAAQPIAGELRSRGAIVLTSPLISIRYRDVDPLPAIREQDWLVFTSRHGVAGLFHNLTRLGQDARALASSRVAAIGPSTERELARHGIRADLVPAVHRADALARDLLEALAPGETVGFPCGSRALDTIRGALTRNGTGFQIAVVYETLLRPLSRDALTALERGVDAILFHSPSAVDSFVASIGEDPRSTEANPFAACYAAIGPTTAERLQYHGLRADVVAEDHTDVGLVNAVEAYRAGSPARISRSGS